MDIETTMAEMRKGLLTLAVLQTLQNRELYTAELLLALARTEFKTQEGTLYPLLSRLKRDGLISHRWVESRSGPPRKYYQLSPEGQQACHQLANYMSKLNKQISAIAIQGEKR